MYTPSDKTNPHFIPPCAAELYEVFDRLENAARKGGIFRHHGGSDALLCPEGAKEAYPEDAELFSGFTGMPFFTATL